MTDQTRSPFSKTVLIGPPQTKLGDAGFGIWNFQVTEGFVSVPASSQQFQKSSDEFM